MKPASLDDMRAFAIVARLRSFTKAAAELRTSTSTLSNIVRRLESDLDMRLLYRSSRSVAPTAAGEELLKTLDLSFSEIDQTIGRLGRQRDDIAGTVKLTAPREAFDALIRPILPAFYDRHPKAVIEIIFDHQFRDIIAAGYDAGIRLGHHVEQDMIGVRLGSEQRMALVASPGYRDRHGVPGTTEALTAHRCIGFRVRAEGPLLPWRFEKDGRQIQPRIDPVFVTSEMQAAIDVAADGHGLAYVLEDQARIHLDAGRLIEVLADWSPSFPGFFLYYSSRRQTPPVLAALVAMLRAKQP